GVSATGVAVNPTTNTIYVASFGDGTVSVFDEATDTVTATIALGAGSYPWGMAVSPTTNRIYVTNAFNGTLSVIDGATNAVKATIGVGSAPRGVGVNDGQGTVERVRHVDPVRRQAHRHPPRI